MNRNVLFVNFGRPGIPGTPPGPGRAFWGTRGSCPGRPSVGDTAARRANRPVSSSRKHPAERAPGRRQEATDAPGIGRPVTGIAVRPHGGTAARKSRPTLLPLPSYCGHRVRRPIYLFLHVSVALVSLAKRNVSTHMIFFRRRSKSRYGIYDRQTLYTHTQVRAHIRPRIYKQWRSKPTIARYVSALIKKKGEKIHL